MKCPVCNTSNLQLSERKGIEIDYCPDCRGVWLDRGELDKILERSRSEEIHTYDDRSNQHESHSDHHRKPHKRKKSIFEELFD
jgi:Zn-finger nucleic acid-binding protein